MGSAKGFFLEMMKNSRKSVSLSTMLTPNRHISE
jgi:hypothetical protein